MGQASRFGPLRGSGMSARGPTQTSANPALMPAVWSDADTTIAPGTAVGVLSATIPGHYGAVAVGLLCPY
jgi:hypothetical protein